MSNRPQSLTCVSAMLLALTLSLCSPPAIAQDAVKADAVEQGREALRESATYPWYDSEQDSLRDLEAKAKKADDSETRKTGWQWEWPETKNTGPTRPWTGFPSLGVVFQYIGIALLVTLVLALVYLLVRYFLKVEEFGTTPATEPQFEDRSSDVDRVEQLPFNVRRPDADLLAEARRLYEQGQFDEAIIYLYSYELVQLDKHQHIHLTKGKTNRQYLREARRLPELGNILYRTMIAFEDAFFGHHMIGRERFETCWRQLDQFHSALEQGVAA